MIVSGSGATSGITIKPDEITSIYNQLLDIISELETNTRPSIEKLASTKFYEAGRAEGAMATAYVDANEKFNDLYDNYVRASTLVIDTLNTMIETDEAIAKQIFEAMGLI
ncbi:hypothetical protein [Alkalihalobacillus trypoxylicola]|uniref:LXG domain-containing protein n=1 Tax=Alkalihalobacillus trypoxylicola TaxID=519424 RepID=A0A161PW62_9BACI|nr:hypothetical protein [Alkalihalobacillus trypoxylicola]KYG26030.1 hypothetical protein AZF04_13165 [Alkalihalobacillus trypoxylicola]GAF65115.1 hypothetical protein BTS2_2013 [Bacillus sp. TS-2]